MSVSGSPAGRVLALLERVQEAPGSTGPQLAADLGVSERTVRRYVGTLQELGIPVQPDRGRRGGYRLAAGYRMPPLMISTDEAVAITLALALVAGADATGSGGQSGPGGTGALGSALGKLQRLLPRDVAQRVHDVLDVVVAPPGGVLAAVPDPGHLAVVAACVAQSRTCRLRHRPGTGTGAAVSRDVDPYGVAVVRGHTYLHGWCHLRRARRTFRLDRVEHVEALESTFRPPVIDVRAAVQDSLATVWPDHDVSVLVHAPLAEVEQHVARQVARCERVDDTTTRLRLTTSNLDATTLRLSDHPFAMTVERPDELREAFRRRAALMSEAARRGG